MRSRERATRARSRSHQAKLSESMAATGADINFGHQPRHLSLNVRNQTARSMFLGFFMEDNSGFILQGVRQSWERMQARSSCWVTVGTDSINGLSGLDISSRKSLHLFFKLVMHFLCFIISYNYVVTAGIV